MGAEAAGKVGGLVCAFICPASMGFALRVKGFKRGSGMIVLFIPRCWCDGWMIRVRPEVKKPAPPHVRNYAV